MPYYPPPTSTTGLSVDEDGYLTLIGSNAIPFRVTKEVLGSGNPRYKIVVKDGVDERVIHENELLPIP